MSLSVGHTRALQKNLACQYVELHEVRCYEFRIETDAFTLL